MPPKPKPPEVRFWKFVEKSDNCWVWIGARHSTLGYGIFGLGGRGAGVVRAHRLSYCWANRVSLESIEGLMVRHSCDNPSCVSPAHLLLGVCQDNADDASERERWRPIRGEENCWAKLTEQQVRAIRKLHDPSWHSGFGYKALAKMFGVDEKVIRRIIRREKWAHI
jgi:hypothetical protein